MRLPDRNVRTSLLALCFTLGGCIQTPDPNDSRHPVDPHDLLPTLPGPGVHVAAGVVTGEAPDQPIAFTHKRHVTLLGIDCQFCHSEARKSIHAGIPATQTCMNCHKYVLTDRPEIKKLHEFYASGEPIPWNKVHDLPDYVIFSHQRHVKAGVACTECHGQVALMEGTRVTEKDHDGNVVSERVEGTMTREASLQMGWCLDCHATHPSIEKNYGAQEDLRRAELKDCWTCHK